MNTECKALFAVASFQKSTAQFCKACMRCSNSSKLSVVVSECRSDCPIYVWWTFTVNTLAKTSMVLLTGMDESSDVCSFCFKVTLTSLASRSRNRAIFLLPKFSKTFSIVRNNIKLHFATPPPENSSLVRRASHN